MALAVAVVLMFLMEGLPTTQADAMGSAVAPTSPHALAIPLAPTVVRSAAPIVQRVATPTSGPGYQSLCLLEVLPQCHSTTQDTEATARSLAAGASSWKNITPPSGLPNPPARTLPSMTYYPSAHEVLLFGGYGCVLVCNDTWSFVHNNWTEVVPNSTCTPTTCPSARADAMMAYYAPLNAVLLFGGGISFLGFTQTYGDTWLFYGDQWHNITATAGTPPSPRWAASMAWDPLDNYDLLFGGALVGGQTLGDTWMFNGTWHNITTSVGFPPLPRAGAAMSDSPSGYLLLFGGEQWNGATDLILYDDPGSCYLDHVSWWFYEGHWIIMRYSACPNNPLLSPKPAFTTPGFPAPCGRVDAAVGWSPKNARFVIYGGYGAVWSSGSRCTGTTYDYLNDTWSYSGPPGGGSGTSTTSNWSYVGDSGDPSNRSGMGYATDFTDNYFEIFGGEGASGELNSTWRYFALVHAKLNGPSSIQTNTSILSFNTPFVVDGFGGSGNLSYAFTLTKLRSTNALIDSSGSGCAVLANTTGNHVLGPLPYDGLATVTCVPTAASFNIDRLTVHVWDEDDATDSATASWTFTVSPPETEAIHTEFTKDFYTGYTWYNIFGVFAKVNGVTANNVTGTLGNKTVTFNSVGPFWWNSTPINMGDVSPGSVLHVKGDWSGWTLNATYTPQMIRTPSWLTSLFEFTGASPGTGVSGKGAWNHTYTIYENYSWSVGSSSSFALPSPMLSGNYSLIPAIAVTFSASSSGSLSIKGSLTSKFPSINLGTASLTFSIVISLSGKFTVLNDTQGISDVQWNSAKASIAVVADVGANVPLYGFNILGVQVGFTLVIDVKATVALDFLLLPTTDSTKEIIKGVQVMVAQLIGAFALAITVAVKFSIVIASVEIGGTVAIALNLALSPNIYITAGWLNGTIFAQAQFLFWSVTWNILGPAVIYNWTGEPPGPLSPARHALATPQCPTCHNNGSGATWTTQPRYYATGSYDNIAWSGTLSAGPAVSDIYPFTSVSAAPAQNGGYLFYSDDNAQLSVQQGLKVSGLRLDPSTNRLSALPSPNDPGFVIDHPEVTALSDGSLYVVWAALPQSETSLTSPVGLTSLQVHGARFYPSNQTWGAIRTWTSWGLAEVYGLDASTGAGTLVVLDVPSYLASGSTAEQLLVYDLSSGKEMANLSVRGLSGIVSVRSSLGEAVVESVGGNYSVLNLTNGAVVTVSPSVVPNSHLISESFVTGSPSALALLYRNPNSTQTILYDARAGQVVATLSTDQSATEVQAEYGGGVYHVFDSVHTGIAGWAGTGSSFTNLSVIPEANLQSFGLVPIGPSVLLYSLVTNGNFSQPIVTLEFAEVGASLVNVTAPGRTPGPAGSSGGPQPNYFLYLGIVAVAVVLLLAVVAIVSRRRGGPGRTPTGLPTETPPTGKTPVSGTPASGSTPPSETPPAGSPPTPGSG
jgi:hypothetical protein